MTTFLSTSNISLYTVPFAWLTCFAPHVFVVKLYERTTNTSSKDSSKSSSSASTTSATATATSKYRDHNSNTKPDAEATEDFRFDPTQPRTLLSLIQRNPHPALTPALKGRLMRLEAASLNGYENLGLFCGAVVAANVGLLTKIIRMPNAAGGDVNVQRYVFWMNIHSLGYVVSRLIFNLFYEHGFSGLARGSWFFLGVGCCLSLVVRAGNVLRKVRLEE